MSIEERKQALFQKQVANVELLAAVRNALGFRYRRLCQTARADWERLFGSDPADSCVTVGVQTSESTAIRRSGLLKSRRQPVSKTRANGSAPRFAH
jgi:hypothetical protein